jgi:hypothetical protein
MQAVAIRKSLALSQAQTLRRGYPKGAWKRLRFSPFGTKARSICAAFSLRVVAEA